GSVVSEDLPVKYHQVVGSQSGIYFLRLDGATGAHTTPVLIDDRRGQTGLQRFPDISVDAGSMHVLWWDSRNDPCYSPTRPLGNCAGGSTTASLHTFGASASPATRVPTRAGSTRTSTGQTRPRLGCRSGRGRHAPYRFLLLHPPVLPARATAPSD